ncbi:MAG: Do family serine endopeptidase [Kiritimatiellae bacterium]|nr:Do family serine endopeptidase [Kiritimatiellia bacterium]
MKEAISIRRGAVTGIVLAAILSVSLTVQAAVVDFNKGFSAVAKEATPAVVFIEVEKNVPMRGMRQYGNFFDFFGEGLPQRFQNPRGGAPDIPQSSKPPRTYKMMGQGSGFLISKDGFILTNTHVVGDMDKITVKLADGREFPAKRIGADPRTEVALIKIEADDLPFLKTGDINQLEIGEWVIAIGTPFGLNKTLTVGVVSAKGRTNIGITDYEDFIQTDAAINPGNSGGPLLNIKGEVIGINTAIFSQSGGYMGIGFAVPIDMALEIKEHLVASGYVKRGYIGVYLNPGDVTQEMARSFGHDQSGGVLIAEVMEDGPAAKAGIKSGDIIIELNGEKIKDNQSFRSNVARIMPNRKAEFIVIRDGKRKKVNIEVALMPGDDVSDESQEQILNKVGFKVQTLNAEIAEQLGYSAEEGLVVTEVEQGSDAERQGLRKGMLILEVNRQSVKSLSEFEQAAQKGKGERMLLRVKSGKATIFINLNFS